MKRITLLILLCCVVFQADAQWTLCKSALLQGNRVASMSAWVDTLIVATDGGGIFRTTNQGGGWLDVSGDIASRDVNWIVGGGHYNFLWVGTADGAYHTNDLATYTDQSVGIANRDVSYYGSGAGGDDYVLTTNGGGLFASPNMNGPWTAHNTGLAGGALNINAFAVSESSEGNDIFAVGTEDGYWVSNDSLATWVDGDPTLAGDSRTITDITSYANAGWLYTTRSGMYFYFATNDQRFDLLAGEKLNKLLYFPNGSGGVEGYVMGEKIFHDANGGLAFTEVDRTGIVGEITSAAKTSQFLFVGTDSGFVYKMPLGSQAPVTAAFTATPTSGTAPLTVQFTDQSTTSGAGKGIGPRATAITSWRWDFDNDGVIDSDDQNPTHMYTSAGTYSVKLTVSDGTNTDDEIKTNYITVSAGTPTVTMDISASPKTGPAPLSVQFNDLSTAFNMTITEWAWDFDNDGVVDDTTKNPTHIYQNPGTYSVKLKVGDGSYENEELYVDYIVVSDSSSTSTLVGDFSFGPPSGDAPLIVQFADQSTGLSVAKAAKPNANTWLWDFDNDGSIDSDDGGVVTHTYQNPGTYSVRMIVNNGTEIDTVVKADIITVTGSAQTDIMALFTGAPLTGPAPLAVTFQDTSIAVNTTIIERWWDFENNGTLDDDNPNPTHTYQNPGTYDVTLIVNNGTKRDTLTKTDYITVNQSAQPPQLIAGFSSSPLVGAAPLTVNFKDTSKAINTTITSWSWDFDNNGTEDANIQFPSNTYQNPGTYSVRLIVSDGTRSDTVTKINYLTVTDGQVSVNADFSADQTSGTAPLRVQFSDLSTAQNTTVSNWEWDLDGDGNIDTDDQNPIVTYNVPGVYNVSLRAGDGSTWDTEVKQSYITVNAAVVKTINAGFTADQMGGFIPLTVLFTDTSSAENTTITSWAWDFQNDGVIDATTRNAEWTFAAADTYTVSLTVSDGSISDTERKIDFIQTMVLEYPNNVTVTETVTYPVQEDVSDFQTTDYRMFGVPGNSGMSIADFIGTVYNDNWQAFFDNGAAQNFMVEYDQSATFALSTGKGFWLLHNGPINLDQAVVAALLDNDNRATIPLHPGWNVITNPFIFALTWAAVQLENNITGPIYGYDASFSQFSVMEPFEGYYYFNQSNLSSLKIPYYAAVAKQSLPARPSQVMDIALDIDLYSEQIKTGSVKMGIHPEAEFGLDQFDYRKPRDLGGVAEILFSRPEWDADYPAFSDDIRPELKETNRWDFEIRSGKGQKLTLDINTVLEKSQLRNQAMTLVDWSRGKQLKLPTDEPYVFTGMYDLMKFSVYLGDSEQIQTQLSELLPKEFALSQNYPNPFNLETMFTFSAPRESKLHVEVYNSLGQSVRTIFSGRVTAGHHAYKWDGLNGYGNVEPSGLYFIVASADAGQRFTKKIILLK